MGESLRAPLLGENSEKNEQEASRGLFTYSSSDRLGKRFCVESKKLWEVAGPAIFSRITMYGMNVITQAFAGHLGDLELAAISITSTVVVGFNFGLLIASPVNMFLQPFILIFARMYKLGMGSALETLCGQAYGARQYHMLGIYLQRSWIVLFCVAVLLLPMYIFATPILKLMGQPDDIAELAGSVSIWFIPQHFAFVFLFPIQRYLQSQLKNMVIAWLSAATLILHIFLSWFIISKLEMGLIGAAVTLNIAWWVPAIGEFLYAACGGSPLTWIGFSRDAFSELWSFTKLSVASGIMLCLENWYYRVLVLLTGNLPNPEVAVGSLSICMSINGWEMMIPLGFFAATGVRVANELGAGNGRGAKFAVLVSVATSSAIGLVFFILILVFRKEFALVFTDSSVIIDAVSRLAILLAFTVLLNSVQPVLSGVAIGSGWQTFVAYINVGCYYIVGVPFGVLLGWVFHLGVLGIWAGMIGGTAVQTLVLAFLTYRCDWDREAAKALDRVKTWSTVAPLEISSSQDKEDVIDDSCPEERA